MITFVAKTILTTFSRYFSPAIINEHKTYHINEDMQVFIIICMCFILSYSILVTLCVFSGNSPCCMSETKRKMCPCLVTNLKYNSLIKYFI